MTIELKAEDFGDWDRDEVECAGGELFGVLADLLHHNYSDGDGWYPRAQDVPGIIAEVRGHTERIEEALKKARREVAAVERPARLAAYRRAKAQGGASS